MLTALTIAAAVSALLAIAAESAVAQRHKAFYAVSYTHLTLPPKA